MTVSELIAALQKFEGSFPVITEGCDCTEDDLRVVLDATGKEVVIARAEGIFVKEDLNLF